MIVFFAGSSRLTLSVTLGSIWSIDVSIVDVGYKQTTADRYETKEPCTHNVRDEGEGG